MRSWRKVTMQPIGTPSRRLKFAMAFFAGVNGGVFFALPAGLLGTARLGMPLDNIQSFDNDCIFLLQTSEHLAVFAAFLTADHHHAVILTNLHEHLLLDIRLEHFGR